MTSSSSALNSMMELVFEHKQELSEKSYLDICNKLKKVHESDTKTNNFKNSLRQRLNQLHEQYVTLLKEHDNIPKPNINNAIKYTAAYIIAKEKKLITESVAVSMCNFYWNKENPIQCHLYTQEDVDGIYVNMFWTCMTVDYNPKKRSYGSTKYVKEFVDTVLKHTNDKNEMKVAIERVRSHLQICEQNKFFDDRMKLIVDETRYLDSLYDSM